MTPLGEVSESTASARVAAVYADIRSVIGTGFVNLVYRHLATDPPVLEAAWQALRPALADGRMATQAARLRRAVGREADAWPIAPGVIPSAAAWRLIEGYNRANAINLVALLHLLPTREAASGAPDGAAATRVADRSGGATAPGCPGAGTGGAEADAGTGMDADPDPAPPLPAWADVDAADRTRIERLNRLAEHTLAPPIALTTPTTPTTPTIIAGLYRHLAALPGALMQAEAVLMPLAAPRADGTDRLSAARLATLAEASRIVAADPFDLAATPSSLHAIDQRFGPVLRQLRDVTISKMLPIGTVLARGFSTSRS